MVTTPSPTPKAKTNNKGVKDLNYKSMENSFMKLPPPVSYHQLLTSPCAENQVRKVLSAEDSFLGTNQNHPY
jgi:hypothetical protein